MPGKDRREVMIELQEQTKIKVFIPFAFAFAALAGAFLLFGTSVRTTTPLVDCQPSPYKEIPPSGELTTAKNRLKSVNSEVSSLVSRGSLTSSRAARAQDLARERKELLLATIRNNPSQAAALLLPKQDVTGLSGVTKNCLEQPIALEGKIQEIHADGLVPGTSSQLYYLTTDSGRTYPVYPPSEQVATILGQEARVTLQGHVLDEAVLATSVAPVAPATGGQVLGIQATDDPRFDDDAGGSAPPTTNVLVMMVDLQDTNVRTPTPAQLETNILNQVAAYHNENSYQRVHFKFTVLDWIEINDTYDCNVLHRAVQPAINYHDSSIDFRQYQQLMLVGPFYCYAGLASTGTYQTAEGPVNVPVTWLNTNYVMTHPQFTAHELGHTMSLDHAQYLNCQTTSFPTTGNPCTLVTTNDPYDVLGGLFSGGGPYMGHFNAPHKMAAGWLQSSQVATISTNGPPQQFTLTPIERNDGLLKTVKIVGVTENTYLEYRQPLLENGLPSFDQAFLTARPGQTPDTLPNIFAGALIHASGNPALPTKLIDADPTPANSNLDPVLRPGQSLTIPETNTVIRTLSATPNELRIEVVPGTFHDSPPVVAFTSPANGAVVNNATFFYASASSSIAIQHVTFSYNDGSQHLLATDFATPYGIYFDTMSIPDGTYPFTVTATDGAGRQGSVTNTITISNGSVDISSDPRTNPLYAVSFGQTSTSKYIAQSFTPTQTGKLRRIDFKTSKHLAPPDTSTVAIYLNSGGNPGSVIPQTFSGINQVADSPGWEIPWRSKLYPASGNSPTLTAGTTYWLVLNTNGVDLSNYYRSVSSANDNFYLGGTAKTGASLTTLTPACPGGCDIAFRIWTAP